jgi:hypothetical protein
MAQKLYTENGVKILKFDIPNKDLLSFLLDLSNQLKDAVRVAKQSMLKLSEEVQKFKNDFSVAIANAHDQDAVEDFLAVRLHGLLSHNLNLKSVKRLIIPLSYPQYFAAHSGYQMEFILALLDPHFEHDFQQLLRCASVTKKLFIVRLREAAEKFVCAEVSKDLLDQLNKHAMMSSLSSPNSSSKA